MPQLFPDAGARGPSTPRRRPAAAAEGAARRTGWKPHAYPRSRWWSAGGL